MQHTNSANRLHLTLPLSSSGNNCILLQYISSTNEHPLGLNIHCRVSSSSISEDCLTHFNQLPLMTHWNVHLPPIRLINIQILATKGHTRVFTSAQKCRECYSCRCTPGGVRKSREGEEQDCRPHAGFPSCATPKGCCVHASTAHSSPA